MKFYIIPEKRYLKRKWQGWAIALFEKERIALFLLKRAKKEQKSNLLFLRSFALFVKSERAIRSFALFW